MKKKLFLFIQITISVGLLVAILRKSDIDEIVKGVRYLDSGLYIVGIILSVVFVIINAIKWSVICKVDIKDSIQLTYISQFYATILPGQITGEAVKIVYAKKKGIDISNSTASVLIDKVTSFSAIFFLGLIGIVFDNKSAGILLVFAGLIVASVLMFVFYKRFSLYLKLIMGRKKNKATKKINRFLCIMDEYMDNSNVLVVAILISIVCQVVGMMSHFLVLKAVGLSIHFYSLMWIYAFLSIALFVPISIGGLGVREASYVGFLGLYGISREIALTGSLLIFSITIVNALVGGCVTLGRVVTDWRET
ncbi:MAG: flippase-like domain-containing protein [Lachnospiraceae bacterium]|nr:flippase-like domain-containing protein [Lachnospiraceae bacterium]